MQIPCVSCQSRFRLDSRLVKATGSLVRCSKCKYIFMVYPPSFVDEPAVKDTNIDQSILDELFGVEQIKRYQGNFDQTSDENNNLSFDEVTPFHNLQGEDNAQNPDIEDIDLAELPDLTEYEDLIEWDVLPDEDHHTQHES